MNGVSEVVCLPAHEKGKRTPMALWRDIWSDSPFGDYEVEEL